MMFRTHLIFAFMVAILILPFINTKERIVFIMLICFFGIFPDIDTHNSKIANKIWPLNYLLNFLFGHRGLFHTLFPVLFAGTLVYFITDKWTYVFAVFIGYTSHIFLDALTKKGIALVYPFSKFKIKGIVKTGGFMETCIFILLSLGCILILSKNII